LQQKLRLILGHYDPAGEPKNIWNGLEMEVWEAPENLGLFSARACMRWMFSGLFTISVTQEM
jgi:hypothetical protein